MIIAHRESNKTYSFSRPNFTFLQPLTVGMNVFVQNGIYSFEISEFEARKGTVTLYIHINFSESFHIWSFCVKLYSTYVIENKT